MNVGICKLSIIPLRASPSHRSEMVSQVLFAEQFEVLRQQDEWAHVRMLDTGYEGWLQWGQFTLLPEESTVNISMDNGLVVDIRG